MTLTAPSTDPAAFLVALRAYEGRRVGPAERGPDPVNAAMIRHFCEAIGDELGIYTDAEAAAASVHGGIVAPPVMLQTWTMRGLRGRSATGPNAHDELIALLDGAGFTSVVATNSEQEYRRYLHLGDHLSVQSTIESVSEEKQTALGPGHFVTTRQTYTDAAGEVVATMLFRILKFRPAAAGARSEENATHTGSSSPALLRPRARRPRPAITQDNAFWFEGAREHKLLVQRCSGCGRLRHPPHTMCAACGSLDWEPAEMSGRGVVYSFVVNHHPQVPAFDYPLVVALVALAEGPRLVSNLIDVEPSDVRIGMPVEVTFVRFDEDLTLPQFRPAGG